MSTTDTLGIPTQRQAKQWQRQGKAPRLDLDVPRECCEETIRELIRRRWKKAEMAHYCCVSENDVRRKVENLGLSIDAAGGPTAGTEILWYTHPDQLENITE